MKEFSLTLTQRLLRNQHMKSHLSELKSLVGRAVREDELESLEHLSRMKSQLKGIETNESIDMDIPFSDRNSDRFRLFLNKLKKKNPSGIYIFAENSDSCGTLFVPSLNEINFNFDFSINGGVLSFITSDYSNCLTLDFSVSNSGEEVMDIIRQGREWSKVDY